MLENREIYDTNGTGSDLNRWQRRYRYFVVLHVRAACDLLGHRGHYPCNSAADTTALLTPNGLDTCCSSGPRPAPPHPKGRAALGTLGPRPEIRAGIKAFGGKKCGACLHVATLPATDWVLIGSVNPTSPGGGRPPLAEPPEAALLPERPAVR